MKKIIAVLLLLTIVLSNPFIKGTHDNTIASREDQTGDCLLKGNCKG
jgi:hypothetical protein